MAQPTSLPNETSAASTSIISDLSATPAATNSVDSSTYSRFAETYQSLNRVIHSLQREYLELKREFDLRTGELLALNEKLLSVSGSQVTFGETLTAIFQSVGLGIIVVNSDSVVTHMNDAACRILGVPVAHAIGASYESVSRSAEWLNVGKESASQPHIKFGDRNRQTLSSDRTVKRPDGSTAIISSSVTLLRDAGGQVSGVVEAIQDLTSFRRMEGEIARLKTLAAMGEMAAGIAHEVRNPLAAIGGFAALLERDLVHDEKKRVLAGKIVQGVDSLNQTITSLLDYTRQEELQLRPVELRGFLQQSIDTFLHDEGRVDWKITIRLKPTSRGTHEPKVQIDQRLMRQVLHNLMRNAVEAMKSTGTIQVHYERLSRSAVAELTNELVLTSDEALVVISVSDSGPGIPAEIRERLFFPLATTKPQGTGLGLAMAAKFVQSHGGQIMAESDQENGAVFKILLPMRATS